MKNIIKVIRLDKLKVLEILIEVFWDDLYINWFIGSGKNKRKCLEIMMFYVFESVLVRGDVYFMEDK